MVGPSTGAVTLKHTETDTKPECSIVFGGGRMSEKGQLDWLRREWNAKGLCPNPGFYVATESEWLSTFPDADQEGRQHYVVVGRDGYVELIAERFRWREWMWTDGRRDDVARLGPVVETGSGA